MTRPRSLKVPLEEVAVFALDPVPVESAAALSLYDWIAFSPLSVPPSGGKMKECKSQVFRT